MKRIHSIIMAVALLFAGCTADKANVEVSGEKMVKVSIPTADLASRTMLDEHLYVKWHKGDEIVLVAATPVQGGTTMTKLTNVLDDGYEALFEGLIPEAWYSNNTNEAALYSYKTVEWSAANGNTTGSGDWGRCVSGITLPSVQPLMSGTFARDYNLSAATLELNDQASQLYFRNLCGLLRVNIKGNTDIRSVEIVAPSKMNGLFTAKNNYMVADDAAYTLEVTEKGSSEKVTLVSEEGVALNSEPRSFYACVLPENIQVGSAENAGPGAGNYQVTVTTVEGKTVSKTVAVGKGIVAGRYTDLGEMDVNYTFADVSEVVLDPVGETATLKYLLTGEEPVVAGVPQWIQYSVGGGKINFTAGLYIGGDERTAEITISHGDVVSVVTFRQDPVLALKLSTLYCDADVHADYEIERTEYLTGDYTYETSEWLSATRDGQGNTLVSVAANTTGNERTGVVKLKKGDDVVGTVTVVQTAFNHASLAGDYNLDFWQGALWKNTVQNGTVTLTEGADGKSYKALIVSENYKYTAILTYTSIGGTPSFVSLVCPQDSEYQNIYYGWAVKSSVHVAKKYYANGLGINHDAVRIDDEGTGYDLAYSVADGVICFDFVPNALTRELYPDGVCGLCFPGMGSMTGRDDQQTDLDWMRPLEGSEYLRMIKK